MNSYKTMSACFDDSHDLESPGIDIGWPNYMLSPLLNAIN